MTNPSKIDLLMHAGENAVAWAFGWTDPVVFGWVMGLLFSACVYGVFFCIIMGIIAAIREATEGEDHE